MNVGWHLAFVMLLAAASAGAATPSRAPVPAGTFETILPPAPGVKSATVPAFTMDRVPVTNADFARFVSTHPQWRRDRVARVFADAGYLQHWASDTAPAPGAAKQPVTRVSWFAASAYCEAQGARLPTWYEWERVGAADRTRADARSDPAWRQQILDWYARPASATLPDVGRGEPNYFGVRDIHGLVWEWVQDLGSMMVSGDNREQGDPDLQKFCGSGALSLEQKDNYAMLMRIATLSSMQASYTSTTMGFRCVK
ncbi:MAG TPA: formylglycine-generating enzyme family protein [Steroidobacteraceae bacterium]|jgi:formylglycine-generating enzyme required for sulfatase activity|nr:formylglycine-generating enzyme family protein [Steroidobacteraceae bacterium]